MQIIGFIAASLMGISLGIVGGGGSILTVPVLVYLFGFDPLISTLYSLFIVGTTSAAGVVTYIVKRDICYRTAFIMSLSSVTTVLFVRHFLLPSIPSVLYDAHGILISKELLTMVLFALLMLVSAYLMLKQKSDIASETPQNMAPLSKLLCYGVGVGLLTGLLGAGGGFLLIPTFVILLAFSMRKAIGTSLLIIMTNSLIGFFTDIYHREIAWHDLLWITFLASIGIQIGAILSKRIAGLKLKRAFGFFVLAIGVFILLKEGISYL